MTLSNGPTTDHNKDGKRLQHANIWNTACGSSHPYVHDLTISMENVKVDAMAPSHIVKMLQIWSRASVQTTQTKTFTKLQVHLQRDAYLFHHCSLSAPLCHNDHINSSCLLKQGSDKFQKLKTNCGKTVINAIKYRNTRITEETELCVFTESTQWKHTVAHRCDTNHQTGLHKPLTTP